MVRFLRSLIVGKKTYINIINIKIWKIHFEQFGEHDE
jgi:hypothetical protein